MSDSSSDEGSMGNPAVGEIFGLEVEPELPAKVALRPGQVLLLTLASLGEKATKGERAVLKLDDGEQEITLCTLSPMVQECVPLDVPISSPSVTFSVECAKKTNVHLVGRYVVEYEEDEMEGDGMGEQANDLYNGLMGMGDGYDDEDSEDDDYDVNEEEESDDDKDDDDEDEDDDDDEDEDDEGSDEDMADGEELLQRKLAERFGSRVEIEELDDEVPSSTKEEGSSKKRDRGASSEQSPSKSGSKKSKLASKEEVTAKIKEILKSEPKGKLTVAELGARLGDELSVGFKKLGFGSLESFLGKQSAVSVQNGRVSLASASSPAGKKTKTKKSKK